VHRAGPLTLALIKVMEKGRSGRNRSALDSFSRSFALWGADGMCGPVSVTPDVDPQAATICRFPSMRSSIAFSIRLIAVLGCPTRI